MRIKIQQKIANSPKTQVDLRNLEVTDNEVEEILSELKSKKPMLQSIFLSHNKISDIGAICLADLLNKFPFPALSELSLQFNQIDKNGITALLKLQSTLPNLHIALHGNQLADPTQVVEIEQNIKKLSPK